MFRTNFIAPIVVLLAACTSLHADERRPNIVLMYTDDQPQNCMGIMGNKYIQTPNIDRLAQRGTLFNNVFVTTAICCCNRACLLTGQHMARHGIRDFVVPLSAQAFDQTYSALLRKSGYRTGFLGKYAIGNPGKSGRELSLPADKFDLWYGFDQGINGVNITTMSIRTKLRHLGHPSRKPKVSARPAGNTFVILKSIQFLSSCSTWSRTLSNKRTWHCSVNMQCDCLSFACCVINSRRCFVSGTVLAISLYS